MPTTIIKKIGGAGAPSRDYSTLQAWEDACPADLVTADQIWRGECYNDSEFTGTLTISGMTVDATRYVHLTCASGQSFRDHASVQSNALKYDQSKGAGISVGSNYNWVIDVSAQHTIVEKLQIKTSGSKVPIQLRNGNQTAQYCILETTAASACAQTQGGGKYRNCLMVMRRSGNGHGIQSNSGGTFRHLTIVRPSDLTAAGSGISRSYGVSDIRSCAVFGFSNFTSGTGSAAGDYNATNLAAAAGGANDLTGKTYANQFENATNASGDWRAKGGADLIGAAVTDAVDGAEDIVGTARPSGTGYDIGCWEFVSGGGGASYSDAINESIASGVAAVTSHGLAATVEEGLVLQYGHVVENVLAATINVSAVLGDGVAYPGAYIKAVAEAVVIAETYAASGGATVVWNATTSVEATWSTVPTDPPLWTTATPVPAEWIQIP